MVTGGGRGLGHGITAALAGADVVVLARDKVPAELTARAAALGRTLHHYPVELADGDAIAATAEQVLASDRGRPGNKARHAGPPHGRRPPPEAWD